MKIGDRLFTFLGRLTRLVDDLENKKIYIDKEKRFYTTIKKNGRQPKPDKWFD